MSKIRVLPNGNVVARGDDVTKEQMLEAATHKPGTQFVSIVSATDVSKAVPLSYRRSGPRQSRSRRVAVTASRTPGSTSSSTEGATGASPDSRPRRSSDDDREHPAPLGGASDPFAAVDAWLAREAR